MTVYFLADIREESIYEGWSDLPASIGRQIGVFRD
jgi:hypothetical protein